MSEIAFYQLEESGRIREASRSWLHAAPNSLFADRLRFIASAEFEFGTLRYTVSTVFLCIDHSMPAGPFFPTDKNTAPVLFETAVFCRDIGERQVDHRTQIIRDQVGGVLGAIRMHVRAVQILLRENNVHINNPRALFLLAGVGQHYQYKYWKHAGLDFRWIKQK